MVDFTAAKEFVRSMLVGVDDRATTIDKLTVVLTTLADAEAEIARLTSELTEAKAHLAWAREDGKKLEGRAHEEVPG